MASGENDAIIFAGGLVICKTFIIFTVHIGLVTSFMTHIVGALVNPTYRVGYTEVNYCESESGIQNLLNIYQIKLITRKCIAYS